MKIDIDKQMHFLAGGMIAGIFSSSPELALCAAFLAGLGKEAYDHISNKVSKKQLHNPDVGDFLATASGGAVVVLLNYLVTYLI